MGRMVVVCAWSRIVMLLLATIIEHLTGRPGLDGRAILRVMRAKLNGGQVERTGLFSEGPPVS